MNGVPTLTPNLNSIISLTSQWAKLYVLLRLKQIAFGVVFSGPRRIFIVGVTRLSQLTLSLTSSSNVLGRLTGDFTLKGTHVNKVKQ